jgi:hypothetical protein
MRQSGLRNHAWPALQELKMKAEGFLVVLGLDSEHKPHAARFDLVDEAAVRKAASHKGFSIGRAKTKEAVEIAGKLIEGRILDSGRGLVPFVSMEVFGKLKTVLEIEELAAPIETSAPSPVVADDKKPNPKTAKGAPPKKAIARIASPWDAVKKGSVVLCQDGHKENTAWWECVVDSIGADGQKLVVHWQNYLREKAFPVQLRHVGLLGSLAAKPIAEIKAGSIVLCREITERPIAWFESKVQSVSKDGAMLTARWVKYNGSVTVSRTKIGILPPSITAKATRK